MLSGVVYKAKSGLSTEPCKTLYNYICQSVCNCHPPPNEVGAGY